MTRHMPDRAAALASGLRTGATAGGRAGRAAAGPLGMSAVSAASSARVRAASARPARPHVELVPGQPALHERVLQRLDHLLAVGVARPEPVTGRRGRVFRSCHHRHPPPPHDTGQA